MMTILGTKNFLTWCKYVFDNVDKTIYNSEVRMHKSGIFRFITSSNKKSIPLFLKMFELNTPMLERKWLANYDWIIKREIDE